MSQKFFAGKYFTILLIIILVPFMLCSCDSISEMFDKEITSISLSENEISLTVGDSRMIDAQVQPEDASSKGLVWTSSNEKIAVVKDGTITAKKEGLAVVKVEAENGVSKSCNVTVSAQEIIKITLSDETASLKAGQTIQIEAKVTPVDAKADGLVWSSDSEDIAKVNSSGFVTGVKAGAANIVCKAPNGIEASCTVTVRAVVPATASPTSPTLPTSPTIDSDNEPNTTKSSSGSHHSSSEKTRYSGCIFPDSSTRKLTIGEVSMLSEKDAQQAINEIYARNGHIFNSKSIQQYFEEQSWYVPKGKVDISDFSEIEQYNISLLQEYR